MTGEKTASVSGAGYEGDPRALQGAQEETSDNTYYCGAGDIGVVVVWPSSS